MGQKVNPIGLRLGINRGWDSIWFAKKRSMENFWLKTTKSETTLKKILLILEFLKL